MFTKEDLIAELEDAKLTKSVCLMGNASLVMQGHLESCETIDCLPLERYNLPVTPIEVPGKNKFVYDCFDFGDMRERLQISTGVNGITCQLIESIASDWRIAGNTEGAKFVDGIIEDLKVMRGID